MERYVSVSIKCPYCHKSLMREDKIVNGKPSIHVRIENRGEEGDLFLCSSYGCFDHQSELSVVRDEIVNFSCPKCGKGLNTKNLCEVCGAPMVSLNLAIGGMVNLCSRKGCSKHYVAFEDLSDAIRKFHSDFGTAF